MSSAHQHQKVPTDTIPQYEHESCFACMPVFSQQYLILEMFANTYRQGEEKSNELHPLRWRFPASVWRLLLPGGNLQGEGGDGCRMLRGTQV